MHDTEQLPAEFELRPLPGLPIAMVRRQAETVEHLQAAIMQATDNGYSLDAANYSMALTNCQGSLLEMTAAPGTDGDPE